MRRIIRNFRQEYSLTQSQLAARLGCSQALIAKLEAGKGQIASGNLVAWSKFFGVSPVDLLQSADLVINKSMDPGGRD